MISYLRIWLELKTDRRALTLLEFGLIAASVIVTLAVGFNVLAEDMSSKIDATVSGF